MMESRNPPNHHIKCTLRNLSSRKSIFINAKTLISSHKISRYLRYYKDSFEAPQYYLMHWPNIFTSEIFAKNFGNKRNCKKLWQRKKLTKCLHCLHDWTLFLRFVQKVRWERLAICTTSSTFYYIAWTFPMMTTSSCAEKEFGKPMTAEVSWRKTRQYPSSRTHRTIRSQTSITR